MNLPLIDMADNDILLPTEPTDADLVALSLAGDREAFGQIVARYQSLVCALAYSATGSVSESEDVAQETFVAAWKKLADLREPEKLRPWLCGIARNLSLNRHRDGKREPTHLAESLDNLGHLTTGDPSPALQAIHRDEEAILWRALAAVPEAYREPLVLFYREHQSVAYVANALDLNEDTVRMRLSRGRKLLAEQVEAIVEGTLARTRPGSVFTSNVMAALPVAAISSGKAMVLGATAAKAATTAKGAGVAKSLGLLGTVYALFWPLTALGSALQFAVRTGLNDAKTAEEKVAETPPLSKANLLGAVLEIGPIFIVMGTAVHYYPAHPDLVIAGMVSIPLISFLVAAWRNPRLAKAWMEKRKSWFSPKSWSLKAVGQWLWKSKLDFLLFFALFFAGTAQRKTLNLLLGVTYAGLFVTMIMLMAGALQRWDRWKFVLRGAGQLTFWVMLFNVKDYWSGHPVGFCVTSTVLAIGFYTAGYMAKTHENPTEENREQWQKARQANEAAWQNWKARRAYATKYNDAQRSLLAATIIPCFFFFTFIIADFILCQLARLDVTLHQSAYFWFIAYALVGLISLYQMWHYLAWWDWQKNHREKISALPASWRLTMGLPPIPKILIALLIYVLLQAVLIQAGALAVFPAAVSATMGLGIGTLARRRRQPAN